MTNTQKKNALFVGCGDPRLWSTYTHEREKLIVGRGLKLYNLLIPGPDEGAHGNVAHHKAESFFVGYFHDLTKFEELHFFVHEDCAGCLETIDGHCRLAPEQVSRIARDHNFNGEVFVYISRKPLDDEYDVWPTEEIHMSEMSPNSTSTASVAA